MRHVYTHEQLHVARHNGFGANPICKQQLDHLDQCPDRHGTLGELWIKITPLFSSSLARGAGPLGFGWPGSKLGNRGPSQTPRSQPDLLLIFLEANTTSCMIPLEAWGAHTLKLSSRAMIQQNITSNLGKHYSTHLRVRTCEP